MSTSQPPEIAPTSTTTPPTTTTTVPPIVPTTGTSTTDTSAATTTIPNTSMSMEGLMKVVKELEFQMSEFKEAKDNLAKLEVSYHK